MQEEGEVIADKGDKVLIKVERNSACKKCDQNCDLAQNHDQDELLVKINKKNFDLKKGQRVILEMAEKNMVFSALIVYLLPLLFMIGGYFFTGWLLTGLGVFPEEIYNILGSIVFLLISFYIVRKINNLLENNEDFEPKITDIKD